MPLLALTQFTPKLFDMYIPPKLVAAIKVEPDISIELTDDDRVMPLSEDTQLKPLSDE